MSCEKYLDLISARLDGDLSPEDENALTAHLSQCPACRALAEDLRGLHSALSHVGQVDAPAELSRNVLAQIAKEKSRTRRRFVRQLTGLAACLMLFAGVVRIADSTISNYERQRDLNTPMPLSLTDDRQEHHTLTNDRYLPVTFGRTPAAPSARIIGTCQSLAEFLALFPEDDLSHLLQLYPDSFFQSGRLLTIVLEEPSSSIRHQLDKQGLLTDHVTILRQIPEAGDCAMAAWLIIAEVDTAFSDGDLLAVTFSE